MAKPAEKHFPGVPSCADGVLPKSIKRDLITRMISRVRQDEKLHALMEAVRYKTTALLGTWGRIKPLLKDDKGILKSAETEESIL